MHFHRFAFGVAIVSASLLGLIGRARADFIPQVDYDTMQFNTTTFNSAVGYSFTTGGRDDDRRAGAAQWPGVLSGLPGQPFDFMNYGASANLASVVIDTNDQLSSTTAFGNNFYYHQCAAHARSVDHLRHRRGRPLEPQLRLPREQRRDIIGDYTGAAVSGLAAAAQGNNGAYGIGPYFNVSFSVATVPEPSSLGLATLEPLCCARSAAANRYTTRQTKAEFHGVVRANRSPARMPIDLARAVLTVAAATTGRAASVAGGRAARSSSAALHRVGLVHIGQQWSLFAEVRCNFFGRQCRLVD